MTESEQKRPGLLRRLKRLTCKLALFLVLSAGVGLVAGFRIQESVTTDRGEQIDCGKWAWQDTAGFKQYASYWWALTAQETREVRKDAKRLDAQYGVSKKAKAIATKAGSKIQVTASKIKNKAEEQFGGKQAETAASTTEKIERVYGYSPEQLARHPGLEESLIQGYDALKAGKSAYAQSQNGSPSWQENLRLAKQKFELAQRHLQDAQSLVDSDQNLASELSDLNAYIEDCVKRSTF